MSSPGDSVTVDPSTTTTVDGLVVFGDQAPGDCLTWEPQSSTHAPDAVTVACDGPHRIQLTGSVEPPVTADGAFPDRAAWEAHTLPACADSAEAFMGVPLSPYGRFVVFFTLPFEDGWDAGDREVWCAVSQEFASEEERLNPVPFTGDIRSVDHARHDPPGTCLAPGPPATPAAGPVPCTEPHHSEVVGEASAADHSAPPASGALVDRCDEPARAYLGGDPPAPWAVGIEDIPPESWAVGIRTAHCVLVQPDADGQPVVVTVPAPRP
jgi:hypothetical protein